MGSGCFSITIVILACSGLQTARSSSVGTSVIDCTTGSTLTLGPVDEGYTGDVEVFTGIPADTDVKLVDYLFPSHLQFLQLAFTPGGPFAVVHTKKELDADTLSDTAGELFYSVMCVNTKLNNSRILKINDLNDNAPVFEQKEYRSALSETFAVTSSVLKVKAVDADATTAHNRITYSLVPPAPAEFEIRNDGWILLKKRLNYNTASNYSFTVEARDNGGLSDTAAVFIGVEDFDNMSPYFEHGLYNALIEERQTGPFQTLLPTAVLAKDGDTGINEPVLYSISSVYPSKYVSHFHINANDGVITVESELDREDINGVTVMIQAAQQDDSLKTANAVVLVEIADVNDNPPEFDTNSYVVSILENSPAGCFLLRAIVTDEDQGGFLGTLGLIPETTPFSVGPDGTLTVKDSSSLDREAVPVFTFQIEARETAPPQQSVLANVTVTLLDENDNSPTFVNSRYEGKVFKNQTVGMLVAEVKAEDPDEGANGHITYAIDAGNEDGYFILDESTGKIILSKLIALEDNQLLSFTLHVIASDGGLVPRASSVLVDIQAPGDSKPQFLKPTYTCSVPEEMEPPVEIIKVGFLSVAPAVDVSLKVETHADKFSIDAHGRLSTLAPLDYETQRNYTVQISISDGTAIDQAAVEVTVVDINDHEPAFAVNPVAVNVSEDAKEDAYLTQVLATDADDGFNGIVVYSLHGGEGKFGIDPQTGRLFVTRKLDRETQEEFSMKVVAQDQGQPPRSSSVDVVIAVIDVNDNPPRFPRGQYRTTIPENTTVNALLLTLQAEDLDTGINAEISYRITQHDPETDPPTFRLDSVSGQLQLAQSLDFETTTEHWLQVVALDGGIPTLNGSCVVSVRVQDVNDNTPQFDREDYAVSVFENLPSGAGFVTLTVTDRDEAGFSNGYFLLDSSLFSINPQGTVSLRKNANLDREEQERYILQIVAVDSPADGLSATAQLNITVLDINDNNPQFLPLPDSVSVDEGEYSSEKPELVCRVSATDADEGENGRIVFSISPSESAAQFRVEADGSVLAVAPLDREDQDTYELVIVASDNGAPRRTNITGITISIADVNDNQPDFSQETYATKIFVKNAKEGDMILTLSATDKDIGDNALITYSLEPQSPLLLLDSKTGAIALTARVKDVNEDTELKLTAWAHDKGQPPLSSSTVVLISLLCSSPRPDTVFESSDYKLSVAENEPAGSPVGTVKAVTGNDSVQVTYALHSHQQLFSVDVEGRIRTLQSLDREEQAWYSMAVEAVDTRVPPVTAVTMVTVEVEDVNEAPVFDQTSYSAKVFSIAPYKYSLVQVKATDPDTGDVGQLRYTLAEAKLLFDVDGSSGQVYVVSLQDQEGQVSLSVKATDTQGLSAVTRVQITVERSSREDLVVLSLNKAANAVESKVVKVEESLARTLGMNVKIISITTEHSITKERSSGTSEKSYITFICTGADSEVVPYDRVKRKLESEKQSVRSDLEKVFAVSVELDVEEFEPSHQNNTAVIALSVLLALTLLGVLVALLALTIRTIQKKKNLPYEEHRNSVAEERASTGQISYKGEMNNSHMPQDKICQEESESHTPL